ncbi:P-loop NTPase [Phenylobacterium sp.]|jgi:ATP-binding protein involved in chromosome partitioning|uniref:Mrp/NBP35 family ATP-binding protein n=1 Tax=Phenylobacterium sp. TaxID=1871053 RepID=UPI0037830705
MNDPTGPQRADILTTLDQVRDPKSGQGLVAAGLVRGLVVRGDRAAFMLEVAAADIGLYAPVREAAERALAAAPGIGSAQVVLTAEGPPAPTPPQPRGAQPRRAQVAEDPQARLGNMPDAERPPHVRKVIAVASGKGGVGKSTVAVNLAVALSGLGHRVGLLDADIYGPSAPQMLGLNDQEPTFDADKKLNPLEAFGVQVMSVGFIVEPGAANIWRGPMATSALRTLMGSNWGAADAPLDALIVDLPPGTGDIQLTLVQRLKIDGVIIVSTPQELALIDARRAATMFQKVGTPILGVVENMAFFPDPATGARIPIFGEGGAKAEAARLGVPLLAEVPIDPALRQGGDEGRPLVIAAPMSPAAQAFFGMAQGVV